MEQQQTLFVQMALESWNSIIKRASAVFNGLSDEQLLTEVAPGRNRGVYLLGHLTAVHDRMFSLLGIGDRLWPQFDEAFISNPDKSTGDLPSIQELRDSWKTVNDSLHNHFSNMSADDWMQKHTAVSDEDFAKEPHRNRLNVLLNRTNHVSYHLGQVALTKK